jgi:hypothetical protein
VRFKFKTTAISGVKSVYFFLGLRYTEYRGMKRTKETRLDAQSRRKNGTWGGSRAHALREVSTLEEW